MKSEFIMNKHFLIEAWLNKTQLNGRTENDSLVFDEGSLYSFGKEIAAIRETPSGNSIIFINAKDHSSGHDGIKGHQSEIIWATRNLPRAIYNTSGWYVNYPSDSEVAIPRHANPLMIWKQYQWISNHNRDVMTDERSSSQAREANADEALEFAQKANRLKEVFNLDVPTIETENLLKQKKQVAADRNDKLEAHRTKQLQWAQAGRDRWLAGLEDDYPGAHSHEEVLRLNPSNPLEVESSSGGRIPTELFRCQLTALGNRVSLDNLPNLDGIPNVELYLCPEGSEGIDLYLFSAAEIERFAKVLQSDEK